MKLGAQLYSVRSSIQTPEEVRSTFARLREIGYEAVQFSGAPTTDAAGIRAASEEYGLPVVCTHVGFDRITGDTAAVIREHKTFGCPVIGLGSMPGQYRGSRDGLEAFLAAMRRPVEEIQAAGLLFAYHNHAFEFEREEGSGLCYFDLMLELCPSWQWIPDTYWMEYAGCSAVDCLCKIGRGRAWNVHFKDMAADSERSICACGDGVLDFARLAEVCRTLDVRNILVEQDNAVRWPDPFDQMKQSFSHLRPIV